MSVKWNTKAAQQVYDDMIVEAKKARDSILECGKERAIPCFDEDMKAMCAAHSVYIDGMAKAAEAASETDSRLIFALKSES